MKKNKADVVPEMTEDTIDSQKVLAVGSTGLEVERLQTALKGGLVVDGNFGALTEKRLKAVTGKTSISIREYNNYMASKNKNKIMKNILVIML